MLLASIGPVLLTPLSVPDILSTCANATALQAAKGGRRDSLRRIEKRASQPSFNGIPDGNTAASASLQTSTDERQALLSRLQGSEQNRGDLDELLATSAKVLQDAGKLVRSPGVWQNAVHL